MKDFDVAVAGLKALAEHAQGDPLAMAHIARRLRVSREAGPAVELALQAIELCGGKGEAAVIAAGVLSKGAPRWHFNLIRDRLRNAAYKQAIESAVFPGCRVLEIGAGSGLLALYAARAGAGHVITCELDPAVAEVARRNVEANGYADRITVLNKHSSLLDLEADLGGPADILVSEILSDTLLSEGVIPSHADALQRLVKPGATVIPARGQIRVALAKIDRRHEKTVTFEEGFDLSAVNLLLKPERRLAIDSPGIRAVGPSSVLFDFAFDQARHPVRETAIEISGLESANGVLQWISMDMFGDQVFENLPGAGNPSSWGCVFWPFADDFRPAAGESVRIGARHDDMSYWLWREG